MVQKWKLTLFFVVVCFILFKDTLFTAGPCILGASINDVLQLHRQTGFEPGDIDLFPNKDNGQDDDDDNDRKKTMLPSHDPRFLIPGRSIILKQDKEDMGSHRFTWEETNMVASATDMPDYDDRPKALEHYSKTHEKFGVYGLNKLYKDAHRANEEFTISIVPWTSQKLSIIILLLFDSIISACCSIIANTPVVQWNVVDCIACVGASFFC